MKQTKNRVEGRNGDGDLKKGFNWTFDISGSECRFDICVVYPILIRLLNFFHWIETPKWFKNYQISQKLIETLSATLKFTMKRVFFMVRIKLCHAWTSFIRSDRINDVFPYYILSISLNDEYKNTLISPKSVEFMILSPHRTTLACSRLK